MAHAEFDRLLDTLCNIYAAEGRPEATATARALAEGGRDHAAAPKKPTAFDPLIAGVLTASSHPAAASLLAARHLLAWDDNPVADRMTGEASAICAVATLMGPDGPIHSPHYRLGFLYQQPNSYYALHNHDADETYVILAGRAVWTAGDDTRLRGAGDYIHHPSLMPHAFRAGAEGFLALWRWSGDINTHSYTFLPDAAA